MLSTKALLERFQSYINAEKIEIEPTNLYEPVNYILSIGGKRIRPLLVLLSAQLYEDDISDTLPIAYSIEMFHNFTLLHDDIMDEAVLRRGYPTVHTKYNLSAGILSGDVMLLYSYKYLQTVEEPALAFTIQKEFTEVGIKICEGQQLDMDFEKRDHVEVEEYIQMIKLKTAILLGLSLKIGALSKNAKNSDQQHLEQFGINLGIAFQIQDDVLDVFGEHEKFGKKSGGDIIQNKKTYLYLKSLELATDEEKEKLISLYSNNQNIDDDEKIRTVKEIFNNLVIVEYARQLMEAYTDLAFSHLDAVNVDENRKENLKDIATRLMKRNH
jgi:geranylgeranyl diphosphate synthase type II